MQTHNVEIILITFHNTPFQTILNTKYHCIYTEWKKGAILHSF